MNKFHTVLIIFLLSVSMGKINAQTGNNVLVEYATGTWCGYCPCGHDILGGVTANYPNTVILAYHGGDNSTDPWWTYSSGIRPLLGFTGYPTGVIGRKTGALSRSAWNNQVVIQSNTIQPGVSIQINKTYDANTRQLTATANVTALANLTGNYFINFVLTEDNLVYPQNYYADCGTPGYVNNYVHGHVVKQMINGALGEALNTGGTWSQGSMLSKNMSYTLPAGIVPQNAKLVVFVYLSGTTLNSNSNVQQATQVVVDNTTGISNNGGIVPEKYSLSQNYPNPFNPKTNITFSVPTDGEVSLKFYDVLGNEVAVYLDAFVKAGIYSAAFDGSALSSGIYFYTLKGANFVQTKKMILSK